MKFTSTKLFEIAEEEYSKAGMLPCRDSIDYFCWSEGVGEWAKATEMKLDAEEEIREELKALIEEEKEMRMN